jgi:hypothetical protein
VGDKPEVYLPDKETVGLMLGLKLSPAIEYARDLIAEELCKSDDYRMKMAGRALGSMSLHPAYVPFSGRMMVEEDHEVVEGLGKEFSVQIPPAYRIKAYTTFGWQYVLPSDPAKAAKERAKAAKEKAREIYRELSEFTAAYSYRADSDAMLSALDSKLLDSAIGLRIEDERVVAKIDRGVGFDGRAKAAIEFFRKYMPVKAVAVSDDFLAGVIVSDEWFRPDGVRAVYITLEAEASSDASAWRLIGNSVVWASKFEYRAEEVPRRWQSL